MTELISDKTDKRVIFPSGQQHRFLLNAAEKLQLSWVELAGEISVSKRTLNDWKREKYSIPLRIVQVLSSKAKIKIPSNIKLKNRYWYTALGGVAGAKVVLKKYGRVCGDPEYRKKKWYEWWEEKGKYQKHPLLNTTKAIKKPRPSKELAEFVGIMMGDGGITKWQLRISTNSKSDKQHAYFSKKLIQKLFNVPVSVGYRKDQNEMYLTVSRIELVKFCKNKLGLRVGNKLKQGLDIPSWIKKNIEFQKACLRGLIDTDGCVFTERHKIKNKVYGYKRLNFVSMSPQLRKSVFKIFQTLDFPPRIRNNRSVQIENKEEIIRYFKVVGTHNPKHKRRFMEG